jgi:hypothetical protein
MRTHTQHSIIIPAGKRMYGTKDKLGASMVSSVSEDRRLRHSGSSVSCGVTRRSCSKPGSSSTSGSIETVQLSTSYEYKASWLLLLGALPMVTCPDESFLVGVTGQLKARKERHVRHSRDWKQSFLHEAEETTYDFRTSLAEEACN